MSKQRAKGTRAETAVVEFLQSRGLRARRLAPAGAQDKGDVEVDGWPVAIEVKNCATQTLAAWVDEANVEAERAHKLVGVVWFHRRGKASPGNWFVVLDGQSFLDLMTHSAGWLLD